MTGRLIAVGDIHGCHAEFSELLDQLELKAGDRLVLLGDLVNRGPDSTKVIDLARSVGAVSLLGNHELRLLKFRKTGDRKYMKEHDLETFDSLRPEDWAYLESMKLTFEEPELNTVFVHGGFLPNEPWQRQPAEVVTRIQVIDKDGRPRKRADAPDPRLGGPLGRAALRGLRPHAEARGLPAQVVDRDRHGLRHGRPPHGLHPARAADPPGEGPAEVLPHERPKPVEGALLLCLDLQPVFLRAVAGGRRGAAPRCQFAVAAAAGLGMPVAFTEQVPGEAGGTEPALLALAGPPRCTPRTPSRPSRRGAPSAGA
jgi:serine/threonine protein phosphatase 1